MRASKWHKRAAALFNVNTMVNSRKILIEGRPSLPGNFVVPGVEVSLLGPIGQDDQNWLKLHMTAEEAEDFGNQLLRYAGIARENG